MRQRELRLNWFHHPRSGWSRLAYIDPGLARNQQGILAVWPDRAAGYKFIGQGNISEEIAKLKSRTGANPDLLVSWAPIQPGRDRDGAVRYLAERLRPQLPTLYAAVPPVRVNGPYR